jgi:hypothetical protein
MHLCVSGPSEQDCRSDRRGLGGAPACLHCPCCLVLVALPPLMSCAGQPSFVGDPLRGTMPSLFGSVAGVGRAVGLEPAGYPLALLREGRTKAKAGVPRLGPIPLPPFLAEVDGLKEKLAAAAVAAISRHQVRRFSSPPRTSSSHGARSCCCSSSARRGRRNSSTARDVAPLLRGQDPLRRGSCCCNSSAQATW